MCALGVRRWRPSVGSRRRRRSSCTGTASTTSRRWRRSRRRCSCSLSPHSATRSKLFASSRTRGARLEQRAYEHTSLRVYERRERSRILLLDADHSVFRMLVLVDVDVLVQSKFYTYTLYYKVNNFPRLRYGVMCTVRCMSYIYSTSTVCQIKLPL